jgi:hypothetical protein
MPYTPKQHTLAFLLVLLGPSLLDAPLARRRCSVVPAVTASAYLLHVEPPRRLPPSSSLWHDPFLVKGRTRGGGILVAAAAPTRHEQAETSSESTAPSTTDPKPKAPRRVNYVRPSAAIERGSGFFVPGLEGGKARLAMGTVLVALCIVQQHQLADLGVPMDGALAIASLYSGLVLLQSGIEFAQDSVRQERSRRAVSTDKVESGSADSFAGSWAGSDDADVRDAAAESAASLNANEYKDRVEWAASTYLSLTPATRMLLVHKDKVVFDSQMLTQTITPLPTRDESVDVIPKGSAPATALSGVPAARNVEGRTNPVTVAEDLACRAALATLEQSATGRVALPPSHRAFQFFAVGAGSAEANDEPPAGGSQRRMTRTVILQKISPHSCWAVASSDLLAAFTPQDLTWLGQLASYLPS